MNTNTTDAEIYKIRGRTLRFLAMLTDGKCCDEHYRWITAPGRDRDESLTRCDALADALRGAGVPLCQHNPAAEITTDLHAVFRDLDRDRDALTIWTIHGPGGSTWTDVPAGSAAAIQAAIEAVPAAAGAA